MNGSFLHKMNVVFRATVIQNFRFQRKRREASEQYIRDLAEEYKSYKEKFCPADNYDDHCDECDDFDFDYDLYELDYELDYDLDCCDIFEDCISCPDFDSCGKKKRRAARKMRLRKKRQEEEESGIGAIL